MKISCGRTYSLSAANEWRSCFLAILIAVFCVMTVHQKVIIILSSKQSMEYLALQKNFVPELDQNSLLLTSLTCCRSYSVMAVMS